MQIGHVGIHAPSLKGLLR